MSKISVTLRAVWDAITGINGDISGINGDINGIHGDITGLQNDVNNRVAKTGTAYNSDRLGGVAASDFYRAGAANPVIRMGTDTPTNFDGIVYDEGANTFAFKADADPAGDDVGGARVVASTFRANNWGNVIEHTNGKPLIKTFTANGGATFGADDAAVFGSGEAAETIVANVSMSAEKTHIGSDNEVFIYSNLQGGWSERKSFGFSSAGNLWIDGNFYADGNKIPHAGLAAGSVGTLAMLEHDLRVVKAPNSLLSGSNLKFSNAHGSGDTRPSGTWRLLGHLSGSSDSEGSTSLFIRVS